MQLQGVGGPGEQVASQLHRYYLAGVQDAVELLETGCGGSEGEGRGLEVGAPDRDGCVDQCAVVGEHCRGVPVHSDEQVGEGGQGLLDGELDEVEGG